MRLHNRRYLKAYRRQLRTEGTKTEAVLWSLLKGRRLEGRKFRRQHSVGSYILDFYCPSERLAIELDGSVHEEVLQGDYDQERTQCLDELGIRVVRVQNEAVLHSAEHVLELIASYFSEKGTAR